MGRSYSEWTPELLVHLKTACESGNFRSITDMREKVFPGYTYDMIYKKMQKMGYKIKSQHREIRAEFIRARAVESDEGQEDIELWEYKKKKAQRYIKKTEKEGHFYYDFKDNKAKAIAIFSDQHFGNDGVDYELAEQHAKIIANSENMYCMMGGDAVDNFIKLNLATPLINKTSSPKEEVKLFRQYLRFFKPNDGEVTDKIIGMISGNHDRRTKDVSGLDIFGHLVEENKIWYAPNEVRLEIKVGCQLYKIAMRHQYKFNSALNRSNTVQRWYDEGEDTFDVGIVCHNHQFEVKQYVKHGKIIIAIRPGTYKISDTFGREQGYAKSVPVMPVVVFSPDKHVMESFKFPEEASEYVRSLNEKLGA